MSADIHSHSMKNNLPVYQYTPIIANEEIRVLRLEPAQSFAEPLVASLFVRTLYDPLDVSHPLPTYQCVSYCWGTQQDVAFIVCDRQCIEITQNVDIMLRYLRKSRSPRNLWIDALCINQRDDEEKSTQVGSMSRIYRSANKVHVWLGPESGHDHIPTVFAALKLLALDVQHSSRSILGGDQAVLQSALNSFLTRAWYTRRWVLQEVKTARAVTVHCGPHRLSWDWVRDGIATLLKDHHDKHTPLRNTLISADIARALEGLSLLSHHKENFVDVFELLWYYHSNNCTDARDRIFALYGLLPPSLDGRIHYPYSIPFTAHGHCPVDYQKHFSETYIQLATAAINYGRGQTILNHAVMFGNLMQQNPDWPSWVPAWNKTRMMGHYDAAKELFLKFDEYAHSPRLVLHGQLCPVDEVQVTGESADIMEFFSAANWRGHSYIELVSLLIQGIKFAGLLHDRDAVNPGAIIPEEYTWARDHDDNDDVELLRPFLRKELSPPQRGEYLPNSPESLLQEIRRVMNGLSLFKYRLERRNCPGIAFGKVEPGDFHFWLNGHESPLSYALILRLDRDINMPSTFRLVGGGLGIQNQVFGSNVRSEGRPSTVYLR